MSVEETIQTRHSSYGSFDGNATAICEMLDALKKCPSYASWEATHRESIHMILHKIARLANGDPNHLDTIHDIGGYAKLLEDHVQGRSTMPYEGIIYAPTGEEDE